MKLFRSLFDKGGHSHRKGKGANSSQSAKAWAREGTNNLVTVCDQAEENNSNMLCDRCLDLFRGELKEPKRLHSWALRHANLYKDVETELVDVNELRDRVMCLICHKTYQHIMWQHNATGAPAPERVSVSRRVGLSTRIHRKRKRTKIVRGRVEIQVSEDDTESPLSLELSLQKSHSLVDLEPSIHEDTTDSASSFKLASTWLKDCIQSKSHVHCHTNLDEHKLPTRILELGSPDAQHIRLRTTSTMGVAPLYMTLSHCWGGADFLTLTSDTVEQLSAGIPLSLLAQTFQDAARIAQELGAQFLWIDSLCIFQDSIEDWQKEAPMMQDVYRGSLCNIAASGSGSSLEGCFRKRKPQLVKPCIVKTSYSHANLTNLECIVENSSEKDIPHDNDQPLFRRGWVLQERYLAPRTLHFGSEYIFWECKSRWASEVHPIALVKTSPFVSYSVKPQNSLNKVQSLLRWSRLVQEYSKCSLTKPSDKLVAFSGVARDIDRSAALGEYLAGHWRENLEVQLLWRCKEGAISHENCDGRGQRPEHYLAPSWSWASLNHKAIYISRDYYSEITNVALVAKVVATKVKLLTNDSFGEVKAGYLRIQGKLIAITVDTGSFQERILKDKPRFVTLCRPGQSYTLEMDRVGVYMDDHFGSRAASPSLYFLPIAKHGNQFGIAELGDELEGLLLRPTGRTHGEFERCGVLTYNLGRDDKFYPWLQTSSRAHQTSQISSVASACTEQDGDAWVCESFDGENYTLTIV